MQGFERMDTLLFAGFGALDFNTGRGVVSAMATVGALSPAHWIVLAAGVVMLLALVFIAWLLVHLLGQNGRLLVRLDRIEAALEDADIEIESDDLKGLSVGSPAPKFSLSGVYGETMTLEALRTAAKPVLLIFTDPQCGSCETTLEDASRWERAVVDTLTVAVIADGPIDQVRKKMGKYKLKHLLVEQRSTVSDAYHVTETPSAVLVRPDGTIGSGRVAGVDSIRELVTAVREGREPEPERVAKTRVRRGSEGIGKDAPVVELKNLDSQVVRLADFAGQPTAILFWSPNCGFCHRMLPDLKAWEENPPEHAPKLLVVSTGTPEANREMGLLSPVVLDEKFAIGRAFGAIGTPSARLVGPDGKIASELVVGPQSVMDFLRSSNVSQPLDVAATIVTPGTSTSTASS
jgi:peroxiredoxin